MCASLSMFQARIFQLAVAKGYSLDFAWLAYSLFKEAGEMVQAIEHKKSEDEIADEFSDLMHFALQLCQKYCPHVNIDLALDAKIKSNWQNKKKSYVNGEIVRL